MLPETKTNKPSVPLIQYRLTAHNHFIHPKTPSYSVIVVPPNWHTFVWTEYINDKAMQLYRSSLFTQT